MADSSNGVASAETIEDRPSASSTSAVPAPQCAQCHAAPTPKAALKDCLKCHSAGYCNKECQKAHFKVHKKVCAGLAQEYALNNEPKMARSTQGTRAARDRGLQKWQFDT